MGFIDKEFSKFVGGFIRITTSFRASQFNIGRCKHGSLICNSGSKEISPPSLQTFRAPPKQGNPIFVLDHDATTTTLPRASEGARIRAFGFENRPAHAR